MQLICPVCQQLLNHMPHANALQCENNHSFDRAKQGYWNLLLVQNKRSKDPGDNPTMIMARSHFLNAGHYQPVSDALNALAKKYTHAKANIIDLGCGEGYYTEALKKTLPDAQILGLDISKHAIKQACKRPTSIEWLVGSSAKLPVPEHSTDLAVIVFSRILSEPLYKALNDDGHIIIAYPGPRHLYSLRECIYKEVRDTHSSPEKHLGDQFERIDEMHVEYPIEINDPEMLNNLLMMTPHGQRAANSLTDVQRFSTTVDINLAVFKKSV